MKPRYFASVWLAGALATGPAVAADGGAGNGSSATTTLSTVTVEATPPDDYGVADTRTATKTDTPLLDVPQSVQVIDRALLDDRASVTLEQALRNVAGVMPGGYYSDYDYFRIRGFDASGYTYLDGLPLAKGLVTLNKELFGLQRIEVVKGPVSTLYGAGSLSGMVNLVSKRPQPENFVVTQFGIGSDSYYEPAVDANGVLDADDHVYGRLNMLYRDRDLFVDYTHRKQFYAAPSLRWDIDSATRLTLLSSYSRDDDHSSFPLPALGTVLPNPNGTIPITRYNGEPAQPGTVREWTANAGYELTHAFNDAWSVRQNLRYSWDRFDWDNLLYPTGLSSDLRSEYRAPFYFYGHRNVFDVDTSALGKLTLLGMRHTVLVGVDYYDDKEAAAGAYGTSTTTPNFPLDLFDPQYGTPLPGRPANLDYLYNTMTREAGLYAQDQVALTPWLIATLGGRYDRASSESAGAGQQDWKFSPRLGLTWKLRRDLSAYINYSRSFLPQSGVLASGAPLPPETGDNREIGLKGDLLEGRLQFTAALYQLTRHDVANANPLLPGVSTVSGEQRSRGFELDSTLLLLPGWATTLAYTYADAKVTEDANALAVGRPLLNVPRNSISLWTRYTLQAGTLRGLGFGLGGNYYSHQSACDPDDISRDSTTGAVSGCSLPSGDGSGFNLPAYGLLNAAVYYERGPLHAQVNIDNLTDTTYYAGSYNALYVQPGAPRSVLATVSYRW